MRDCRAHKSSLPMEANPSQYSVMTLQTPLEYDTRVSRSRACSEIEPWALFRNFLVGPHVSNTPMPYKVSDAFLLLKMPEIEEMRPWIRPRLFENFWQIVCFSMCCQFYVMVERLVSKGWSECKQDWKAALSWNVLVCHTMVHITLADKVDLFYCRYFPIFLAWLADATN